MNKQLLLSTLVTSLLLYGFFVITPEAKASHGGDCTITIGDDGKSETYTVHFNQRGSNQGKYEVYTTGSKYSFPSVMASSFIRKTTGKCKFTVYNSRNYAGRNVILGTGLTKRIRAGIGGVDGTGDTWRVRSIEVEFLPTLNCSIRIGGNGVRMIYYLPEFYYPVPAMNRVSWLRGDCPSIILQSNSSLYDYSGKKKYLQPHEWGNNAYDPGFRARSIDSVGPFTPDPIRHYYGSNIVSARSQKCLDVHLGDIYRNGAKVQQWDCYGMHQTNQLWAFKRVGNCHTSRHRVKI